MECSLPSYQRVSGTWAVMSADYRASGREWQPRLPRLANSLGVLTRISSARPQSPEHSSCQAVPVSNGWLRAVPLARGDLLVVP